MEEIMNNKLLGYGFLPAKKVKILAINEEKMTWIALKKFGLKKVPVGVYRISQDEYYHLIDYKYIIDGINLPISSLYYYTEYHGDKNKLQLYNYDDLQNSILVYENTNDEKYETVANDRFLEFKPELVYKNEVTEYIRENDDILKAIKNCYHQSDKVLDALKVVPKKIYKMPKTKW